MPDTLLIQYASAPAQKIRRPVRFQIVGGLSFFVGTGSLIVNLFAVAIAWASQAVHSAFAPTQPQHFWWQIA